MDTGDINALETVAKPVSAEVVATGITTIPSVEAKENSELMVEIPSSGRTTLPRKSKKGKSNTSGVFTQQVRNLPSTSSKRSSQKHH